MCQLYLNKTEGGKEFHTAQCLCPTGSQKKVTGVKKNLLRHRKKRTELEVRDLKKAKTWQ